MTEFAVSVRDLTKRSVVPVTHFLRIVRGVMLKGWTTGDAAKELVILATMGGVLAVVASFRYGSTLE
jgi:ABC-2 type transport system permease protein